MRYFLVAIGLLLILSACAPVGYRPVAPPKVINKSPDYYNSVTYDSTLIYFASNTAKLSSTETNNLRKILPLLQKKLSTNKNLTLRIEGHNDSVEGRRKNGNALAKQRADSIAKYISSQGRISPQRIKVFSYGASRPGVAGTSAEALRYNRRVEILYPR